MSVVHADILHTWSEPTTVSPRGTLIVLTGRGEAPLVYERFGQRLAADAYRVRILSASSNDIDATLKELGHALDDADPSIPRVVVGSDAGAAHAAYLAGRSMLAGVSALVLAGLPTVAASTTRAWSDELDARTACSAHRARIGAAVTPGALFNELEPRWLQAPVPERIGVPVLGLHGRDDVISPVDEARRWYARVPQAEVVTIVGGRHDVLNDQSHRSVAATIVLFLERLRLGADRPAISILEQLASNDRADVVTQVRR